jgi:hypothetical protein
LLETLALRGASPPWSTYLDPMVVFGVPQTPRRRSLIAHSFTSSYAPEYATLLKTKKKNEKSMENKSRFVVRLIYKMAISRKVL